MQKNIENNLQLHGIAEKENCRTRRKMRDEYQRLRAGTLFDLI
jgi:hypothetical protein